MDIIYHTDVKNEQDILPLSYYFSLDRFERVQQGEKEMIELANKKTNTSPLISIRPT